MEFCLLAATCGRIQFQVSRLLCGSQDLQNHDPVLNAKSDVRLRLAVSNPASPDLGLCSRRAVKCFALCFLASLRVLPFDHKSPGEFIRCLFEKRSMVHAHGQCCYSVRLLMGALLFFMEAIYFSVGCDIWSHSASSF